MTKEWNHETGPPVRSWGHFSQTVSLRRSGFQENLVFLLIPTVDYPKIPSSLCFLPQTRKRNKQQESNDPRLRRMSGSCRGAKCTWPHNQYTFWSLTREVPVIGRRIAWVRSTRCLNSFSHFSTQWVSVKPWRGYITLWKLKLNPGWKVTTPVISLTSKALTISVLTLSPERLLQVFLTQVSS